MSEQLGFFDPEHIQTEAEMRSTVQDVNSVLANLSAKDDKKHKEAIVWFLNQLHDNISGSHSTPKSKLMSLLMLRELTEKSVRSERKEDKNSKLFSLLLSHKMLKHFAWLCETVDPYKPVNEKGKSFFPNDSIVGNDFIRLILQLIKFWAARYSITKNRQPTLFKKTYDNLVDNKVVFPAENKFFSVSPTSRKDKKQDDMADTVPPTKPGPKTQTTRSNPKADVNFMYSRLQNFLEVLDQDDISAIEAEIRTVHALIEKQSARFQKMTEEILDTNDEDITGKYFNIKQLMHKQLQFHARYIDINKDFNSYITEVKLEAQKLFPQNFTPQPQESKVRKVETVPPIKVSSNIRQKTQSQQIRQVKQSNSALAKKTNNAPVKQSAVDPVAITAVSNYFSRLEERSKSPITGFKKINESLSKQKASTLNIAVKRSVSPLNKSKTSINKSLASLKQSKIAPIFASPPNLNPPRKLYDGIQIRQNFALSDALHGINKHQGVRRFKTANFKNKSSLFENQHLQIGYKSEPIYEQVSGFKVLMKIQLFFGNLAEESIQDFNLQFKGDSNVLLYANPKVISNMLPKSEQRKIQLIIIPLKAPFPLLTMHLSYKYQRQNHDYKIIIPNSMLKLTHFLDVSKNEFNNRWTSSQVHKTDEFKLCHYLAPDSFKKWFPNLGQLTSYSSFATPGSVQDYELFCSVIMMQLYEGLLKINIRPNLNVVVQLGIEDHTEQSVPYFLFFLQTMEQFLRQIE